MELRVFDRFTKVRLLKFHGVVKLTLSTALKRLNLDTILGIKLRNNLYKCLGEIKLSNHHV